MFLSQETRLRKSPGKIKNQSQKETLWNNERNAAKEYFLSPEKTRKSGRISALPVRGLQLLSFRDPVVTALSEKKSLGPIRLENAMFHDPWATQGHLTGNHSENLGSPAWAGPWLLPSDFPRASTSPPTKGQSKVSCMPSSSSKNLRSRSCPNSDHI